MSNGQAPTGAQGVAGESSSSGPASTELACRAELSRLASDELATDRDGC